MLATTVLHRLQWLDQRAAGHPAGTSLFLPAVAAGANEVPAAITRCSRDNMPVSQTQPAPGAAHGATRQRRSGGLSSGLPVHVPSQLETCCPFGRLLSCGQDRPELLL